MALKTKKILIASPIYNRTWILDYFIECIQGMDTSGLDVSFVIFDNGSTDNPKDVIKKYKGIGYEYVDTGNLPPYQRGFDGRQLQRLKKVREHIRLYTINNGFDYLFCCDSDILVQPTTLKQLLSANVDFIAATISNSGTYMFYPYACNCRDYIPKQGVYSAPGHWVYHEVHGKGVVPVGGTGAIYLASFQLLRDCSYMKESLFDNEGEDYVFARDCLEKGYQQYIDESHRCLHCFDESILELYKNCNNKKQAVKIITQRGWLGIPIDEKVSNSKNCVFCGKMSRG